VIIKIKRQDNPQSASYWQSFDFAPIGRKTVASILDDLNNWDDLKDTEGNVAKAIRWECSCMQKTCGACAMVVNKKAVLACNEFIDTDKQEELVLEPLSKFPVVADLIVDRSIILEHQKNVNMYIGEKSNVQKEELEHQYDVAKCLKCGLCLEVCPNYKANNKKFYGALMANESYLLYSSSDDKKNEVQKDYDNHFAAFCSKSLACETVCPMHMPTLSSMAFMNKKKKVHK